MSMKIFTTATKKIITLTLIMLILFTQIGYGVNYTREELEARIDKIALERGVPAVFIKAIAQIESGFEHFRSNGSPKYSANGKHVGLMQVTNYKNMFDAEKLKNDVDYNINAGIDVLLLKWNESVNNVGVSKVGNMDPNILENWYFALWAYNGWAASNNPNANAKAYQEKVYDISAKYFEQNISRIDTSSLPASRSLPSRGLSIATPTNKHLANLFQYTKNDLVVINTITNDASGNLKGLELYDTPSGNVIGTVHAGQMAQIEEGPNFTDGYYWYKIKINENLSAWVKRNWIKKVGDVEFGIYPFDDIAYHWCASAVMNLYKNNFISGKEDKKFSPDLNIVPQEFYTLFSKVFSITSESEEELRFANKDEIAVWAVPYIRALDEAGFLDQYGDNINTSSIITRGEITSMIANLVKRLEKEKFDAETKLLGLEREFNANEFFKLSEIQLPFKDIEGLSESQINNIKIVYLKNIIKGENNDSFNYTGCITRAAAASVVNKLYENYKVIN